MARRSLKYNAAILTVTGFLVKVIGFFYRVFIANAVGSEGLGLYQLVTPIYSLLVLVLSAGVQIAVSRFVAEETSRRPDGRGMKITSLAAGVIMAVGLIVCGILLLNLDTLVFAFTGDMRTRNSLLWILIFIPPIAAASAYKGYFYGRQEMIPNSMGQILEQLTKLGFVFIMFNTFKGRGVENMCLLAVISMLMGECANVLTVYTVFLVRGAKIKSREVHTKNGRRGDMKKLFKTALPISANRLILSTLGTAESLMIPQRLMLSGLTFQESLMDFGRLSGMASPLVFFPSMIPSALATALVPAIAGAVASKSYSVANRQISQSIRLTFIMGLVFTSFFACSSNEIAELIFPGENVGGILHLLSYTGVLLYLQQTMLGILNGLSRESTMLINTFLGSVVRLVVIWFVMPILGVDAYIYAVIAGSILTVVLNFREISKITGMSIDAGEWFLKPLTASLAGSLLAIILKQLPELWNLSGRISMLLSVCISMGSIATAFLLTGIIRREDLKRWASRNKIMNYNF